MYSETTGVIHALKCVINVTVNNRDKCDNPVSQDWEEQSEFWCRRFAVLLLGSETLKLFWSLKVEH